MYISYIINPKLSAIKVVPEQKCYRYALSIGAFVLNVTSTEVPQN
jgi:hypothetical protein